LAVKGTIVSNRAMETPGSVHPAKEEWRGPNENSHRG
jgi:hypothetical protein